jgi:hypothetical protein
MPTHCAVSSPQCYPRGGCSASKAQAQDHKRPLTGARLFCSARLYSPRVTGGLRCIADRRLTKMDCGFRLAADIRLCHLPALERSLMVVAVRSPMWRRNRWTEHPQRAIDNRPPRLQPPSTARPRPPKSGPRTHRPGQAAQARVRPRPGALPELRRRAEDHRGDPGATGDREDPHAPGVAGQGTTALAGSRSSAASGLTIPTPHCSSGPARRAAGVGCVPVATGPMETAWRQGVTHRRQPERRISAGQSTPNRSRPVPKDRSKRLGRCVPLRSAPVLPCSGCRREGRRAGKGRLKTLSS